MIGPLPKVIAGKLLHFGTEIRSPIRRLLAVPKMEQRWGARRMRCELAMVDWKNGLKPW
jgi:hypothetical protein